MDAGKIKGIARRIVTAIFGNPDALKELCTPDSIARHSWGAEFKGIDDIIALLKKNVSNPRIVIDDCFAENDRVAVRFRAIFPPEGEIGGVVRNEIAILRFEGEKMAEWWGAYDRKSEEEQRR